MLYREIIDVCSQIHTKHINTLCGQNVEFVNVQLAVHIVTTGLCWGKRSFRQALSVSGDQRRCWHFLVLTQANASKRGVIWYKRLPVKWPVLKRQEELFTGRTAKCELECDICLLRHLHCARVILHPSLSIQLCTPTAPQTQLPLTLFLYHAWNLPHDAFSNSISVCIPSTTNYPFGSTSHSFLNWLQFYRLLSYLPEHSFQNSTSSLRSLSLTLYILLI